MIVIISYTLIITTLQEFIHLWARLILMPAHVIWRWWEWLTLTIGWMSATHGNHYLGQQQLDFPMNWEHRERFLKQPVSSCTALVIRLTSCRSKRLCVSRRTNKNIRKSMINDSLVTHLQFFLIILFVIQKSNYNYIK